MDPPLTADDLRLIERAVNTRFSCDFWSSLPRIKLTFERLLAHIRYLEEELNGRSRPGAAIE
jgi:hypothetical protein